MRNLTELKNEYQRQIGKKEQIENQIEETKNKLSQIKKKIKIGEKAKNIVKVVALETQSQLEYRIASTISAAQQAVFEEPYNLSVQFNEKRNKTECEMMFERDGKFVDPLGASGYGAVDIAAFGLRVACWSMSRNTRPIMILDESFKHLKGDEENKRAILMMKELSRELGLQIITISDERANKEDIMEGADKLFEVNIKNKVSQVEEL